MNREQFPTWRKSTYSDHDANCVEVAPGSRGAIGVRDSKDPHAPHLVFTPVAWRTFLTAARRTQRR
ncbi:DUF397 domain-containing protein [Actinocorallia sp. API 0066]|uniref:DUF397 domain-containing protein n=1 Tax=Actinocorallia sp. API 0066 TaxID=2896846 RepID=UPI001E548E6D|nr:DUF397 domain-containing protein [Actinocorallia sp. API 0066]MCD0449105.1 DUF397 domain-containing protein [Actinocorallia sp. API 0066]